jgi:CheY-like chemotaxis protein
MAKAPRPIRILIVEDYADTRDLYVEFLSMQGHEVVAAEDGLQALHVARTVMPELIVLDINLPKLDGLSVLRRLRAEPRLDPIPVLTLSAAIGREYEEEALESGAVRALHKPLLPDELHDAILEVIEGPQQPRAVASRWSR